MSWVIRHRPKGDTSGNAVAVEVTAATPGEAIEQVRATLSDNRCITTIRKGSA